jgi:predicted dehydrogenase
MKAPLRVGVIGVGELGSRHARLYAKISNAELVGVCDLEPERVDAVARSHAVPAFRDFRELIPEIQAASVAVPTADHHDVTSAILEAGVHVLVEKPIASTLAEAKAMIDLSRRKGLRLAVGHTERYNPAVEAVLSLSSDPRFIEVHRLGSFSPRSLDIDVVLDLMIHDLDVVAKLVRCGVSSVEAVGVPVLTPRVDIANARIRFDNGAVANVTASRVSQEKVRKLRLFEKDCYVSLDYQKQEALRYKLIPSKSGRSIIHKEDLVVEREEPLRRELTDFIEAVEQDRAPRVDGEDGLSALRLAVSVVEAMETGGSSLGEGF